MKSINKSLLPAALILLLSVGLFSCSKSDNNNNSVTSKGAIFFHMHTTIDTSEVDANQVAKDATGRRFSLSVAQFYISDIILHKSDGTDIPASGVFILKTIGEEEYQIDSVPAGNYKSVTFTVGLDATANATSPSSYAAASPLSAQTPSMYFGSAAQGYIFMNIQGMADTTAAQNGSVNVPFSYQLGTSAMAKTVTMPNETVSVIAGQQSFIHINADYGKVLSGINFKTNPTATPFVNASIATQIANNIPSMFRYEE